MHEGPEGLARIVRRQVEKRRLALGLQPSIETAASASSVSQESRQVKLCNGQGVEMPSNQAADVEIASPTEIGVSGTKDGIPRAVSGIPRAMHGNRGDLPLQAPSFKRNHGASRKMLLDSSSNNTDSRQAQNRTPYRRSPRRLGSVPRFGAYGVNPLQEYPVEMTPTTQRLLHECESCAPRV